MTPKSLKKSTKRKKKSRGKTTVLSIFLSSSLVKRKLSYGEVGEFSINTVLIKSDTLNKFSI